MHIHLPTWATAWLLAAGLQLFLTGLAVAGDRPEQRVVEIVPANAAPAEQPAVVTDAAVSPHFALPPPVKLEFPGAQLTLAQALCLTLDRHPELAVLEREVQAAHGRALQGGIKPSPEFEAEIAKFLGTAETRWFVNAESGFAISQVVERGRKRSARIAVAEREGRVAELAIERMRLDLMLQVSEAYYLTLVAQEELALAWEREQLAQLVYDTVGLKVEGGKAALLEQKRTGIELASVRLEREQAELGHRNALNKLASLWGAGVSAYGSVAGELTLPDEAPALEPLLAILPDTPGLRQFAAEEQLRLARLQLALAEDERDYTWSAGLQRFEDTDSFGLNVGISFPLRKRGAQTGSILESQALADQVSDLREAELRRRTRRLVEVQGQLAAAHARARAIQRELLPPAQETFELTQIGYRYGKFGLLEVLDAQRTLMDAQNQYFDAVAEYQLAAVQLERLVAQPAASAEICGRANLSVKAKKLVNNPGGGQS